MFSNIRNIFIQKTNYAETKEEVKKPNVLELQAKQFADEIKFRKKSSLVRTDFKIHGYATSVEYIESAAYKQAYGDEEVWKKYVRNYGGHVKPQWTRLRCIVRIISSNNNLKNKQLYF